MRSMPRRRLPLWAYCVALLVAGCGRAAAPDLATGLRVGAGPDASVSGAFQARLGAYPLNINVAETLVRLAPDYDVEPLLATGWQYRGNNTWRFELRRNVRFHDGSELTADAVRESLAATARDGLGYSFLAEDSVQVVDRYTVDITPARPNLRLPEQLVHPNYSLFAPRSDPRARPVGTGPYQFVEYRPHEHITVIRNSDYWGAAPRIDRVEFRFFPDPGTRLLALLAGEVDLIVDVPREQTAAIEERPDVRVVRAPVGLVLSLQFNSHGTDVYTLLRERAVRQAIAYAVDQRTLVGQVWGGEGEPIRTMSVATVLGAFADRVEGYPYDPSRAERTLEDAGWQRGPDGVRRRDGRQLRLALLANPELDAATVEFVQAQLRHVGIDAAWERQPDIGAYAARLDRGEFDINVSLSNQNDADPLFLPALQFFSKSERPFARWLHASARFDALIEEGMQSGERRDRQRAAADAMRVAIDDEAVMVPLAGVFRLYAIGARVAGFVPHPSQTNQRWGEVEITGEGEEARPVTAQTRR